MSVVLKQNSCALSVK